jgi:hypothetical protein
MVNRNESFIGIDKNYVKLRRNLKKQICFKHKVYIEKRKHSKEMSEACLHSGEIYWKVWKDVTHKDKQAYLLVILRNI